MIILFYKAELIEKPGKLEKPRKLPKSSEPSLNNLSMYEHCFLKILLLYFKEYFLFMISINFAFPRSKGEFFGTILILLNVLLTESKIIQVITTCLN